MKRPNTPRGLFRTRARGLVPEGLASARLAPPPKPRQSQAAPAAVNVPSGIQQGGYALQEIEVPAVAGHMVNADNSYLRAYRYGPLSVIVTREGGLYHMSVAHPTRYPTWEEISGAWYRAVPGAAEIEGKMALPRLDHYVNIHNFCMHVYQEPPESQPPDDDVIWGDEGPGTDA